MVLLRMHEGSFYMQVVFDIMFTMTVNATHALKLCNDVHTCLQNMVNQVVGKSVTRILSNLLT